MHFLELYIRKCLSLAKFFDHNKLIIIIIIYDNKSPYVKHYGLLNKTSLLLFFLLAGCDEYINTKPILSWQTRPPQRQPLDLTTPSSVSLSGRLAAGTRCTFNQTYFIHDYGGFQSRWTTIRNSFFSLTKTSGSFTIKVRVAVINIVDDSPQYQMQLNVKFLFHTVFSILTNGCVTCFVWSCQQLVFGVTHVFKGF